jgi:hypothetical protein
VLCAGQRYRLRITPTDDDLASVHIPTPPDFLDVGEEEPDRDASGRPVRDIPFRVRLDLGAAVYRLGNVRGDDLDVTCEFQPKSGKPIYRFECPVVVRPGLRLAFLGIAGSILSLLAPMFRTDMSFGATEGGDLRTRVVHWLSNPVFWLCIGIIAAVLAGVYGFSLLQLYQRSKELRQSFEERYPPCQKRAKQAEAEPTTGAAA